MALAGDPDALDIGPIQTHQAVDSPAASVAPTEQNEGVATLAQPLADAAPKASEGGGIRPADAPVVQLTSGPEQSPTDGGEKKGNAFHYRDAHNSVISMHRGLKPTSRVVGLERNVIPSRAAGPAFDELGPLADGEGDAATGF